MSGLAPRAREDSVRPRRLSGVIVRPLNFTVRQRGDNTMLKLAFYYTHVGRFSLAV